MTGHIIGLMLGIIGAASFLVAVTIEFGAVGAACFGCLFTFFAVLLVDPEKF